jgi:hemin uptake protein HemP
MAQAADRRVVEARALLQGSRELLIRHGSCEYRLRLTRNDKLILTK